MLVLETHTLSHQFSGGGSVPASLHFVEPRAHLVQLPGSRTFLGPSRDCVLAAHSTLQKNVPTREILAESDL